MITRVRGLLESVGDRSAVVDQPALGVAREVLLPAYSIDGLRERVGAEVTLHTLELLEGLNQGSSFVPRVLGFASPADRAFFELLITVKGVGPRKGLRALAEPPAVVAAAIAGRDAKALQRLPEVGKRLAETIIATLDGKVAAFADPSAITSAQPATAGGGSDLGPAGADAVAALVALGEPKPSAEDRVRRAVANADANATAQDVLDLVFAR